MASPRDLRYRPVLQCPDPRRGARRCAATCASERRARAAIVRGLKELDLERAARAALRHRGDEPHRQGQQGLPAGPRRGRGDAGRQGRRRLARRRRRRLPLARASGIGSPTSATPPPTTWTCSISATRSATPIPESDWEQVRPLGLSRPAGPFRRSARRLPPRRHPATKAPPAPTCRMAGFLAF